MIKRILPILLLVSIFPISASAATFHYGYFGTTSVTSTAVFAEGNYHNEVWIDVTVAGSGTGNVIWWGTTGGENYIISRSPIPGTVTAPSGAISFQLESTNGKEVYAVIGHTTNPKADTVTFTEGGQDGDEGGDSGNNGCIGCDLFNCPGWSQYMGKLDDIKNAIPPAPNWQTVANTFRDTIAPRIKSDLEDVLGRAPTPPSAPKAPAIPAQPEELDDRGITEPTGRDIPEGGEFDEGDIKSGAPVIQEREDPTGGFTINDPISGLPSQDEFKENVPDEGTAELPGNPKELENVAPTPPEIENTAPAPPERDNVAPVPPEASNTAPTPSEGANTAPKPSEGNNTAPKPGEGDNVAPIPPQGSNTAPTPGGSGGDFNNPPIPGNEGSTAPIPGSNSGTAPIPNESGQAPLPGG